MLDKENSNASKNVDTPEEGNPQTITSIGSKIQDTTASTDADTLDADTMPANDYNGDTIAENLSDLSSCKGTTQTSNMDNLLSVVSLCDGPSTSMQTLNESNDSQQMRTATNASLLRAVSPQSIETTSPPNKTATKEICNNTASSLVIDCDCDQLPYSACNNNNNIENINSIQRERRPTISVKCFSPVRGQNQMENDISPLSPTPSNYDDDNDDSTEKRNEHPQSQDEDHGGSEMQSSLSDRRILLPTPEEIAPISRGGLGVGASSPHPVEIIDLASASSEMCCGESPGNSSVNTASPSRASARNIPAGGRRVVCMRHIRRAPKEPEEYLDALFPHIREAHQRIRQALLNSPLTDVKDSVLLKRKMLEVIQLYSRGSKNEFERVGNSVILCRRLKRNIIRLLDLFNEICYSSRQDPFFLYHISQLIAVYSSLEIRLSFNMTRLQKCALIHRLAHVINKHLVVNNESLAKENILRMFLYMPDMYSARFILEPLFNTFLPEILTSSKSRDQKELPDKTFVQYIIVLQQWKEMLRDPFEQVELINKAQHFMCPTKTLHSNSMYANHLPIIHTRKNAVKDILNNLKFFQDLRNAAICDDSMQDVDDDIIVVIDEDADTPAWDFGATYTAEAKHLRHNKNQSRRMTSGPVECVDLTVEDSCDQESKDEKVDHLTWLTALKEKACERVTVDESENVICLDSDSDGELFSGSIIDPSESYQDCDAFDTDYTSLDGSTTDDKAASEDETLPASRITPDGLRTYLAPRSKNQASSSNEKRMTFTRRPSYLGSPYVRTRDVDGGDGDSATVCSKISAASNVSHHSETPWPLILNTFSVHDQTSKQFSKSSRFDSGLESMNEIPEQNSEDGDEEDDVDDDEEYHSLPSTASSSRTTMGKVIFSQALSENNRKSSRREDDVYRGLKLASNKLACRDFNEKGRVKLESKRINEDITMPLRIDVDDKISKPVKKQVKFNDQPIGPTRRLSMNDVTKLPIKPAIQLNKQHYNNQHCSNQHCFNQHCSNQHCSIQPCSNQQCSNQHCSNGCNQHHYYNQHSNLSSSPQPRLTSPASSISSTDSLKQMAQQEHINAITTLFSGYKITKPPPPLVNKIGIPQLNAPTIAATNQKSTHNSHKIMNAPAPPLPPLDTWRNVTNSPQSVCSLRSPPPRTHSTSPESIRSESPVYIPAELAEDRKLRQKCQVLIEQNEHVIEFQRQEAAFINELLEKQREMQRQRALKRQEFQKLAKLKHTEDKRLAAEITEVKRQRDEMCKDSIDVQEQLKEQKRQEQQQQSQSSPVLKRKRMLVKERKVMLKTKANRKTNTRTNVNEEQTADFTNGTSENVLENEVTQAEEINILTDKAMIRSMTVADENLRGKLKIEDEPLPTRVLRRRMSVGVANAGGIVTNEEGVKARVRSSTRKKLPQSGNEKLNLANDKLNKNGRQTIDCQKNNKSIKRVNSNQLSTSTTEKSYADTPMELAIEAASKTSISEKQTGAPAIVAHRTTHARSTRSMSPTPKVYEGPSSTPEHLLTLNKDTSFPLPSPITSRIAINGPSAASTPTRSTTIRSRVEVRRSMQDPCINKNFPSSATSWLLNVSPHTLTKTVRVRLKRLQDLNMMNSSLTSSPEKENKDKSSRLRSASAIPFMFSENENIDLRPLATTCITAPQTMLTLIQSNKVDTRERIEFLKQRLKAQLLEMDEKYGGNVKEVIERVLEKPPSIDVCSNKLSAATTTTALQTAETLTKKGSRRKASRKQASPTKKPKISEKPNLLEEVLEKNFNFTNDTNNEAVNANNNKKSESGEAHFENAIRKNPIENQITATNVLPNESLTIENTSIETNINSRPLTESKSCAKLQQQAPVVALKVGADAVVHKPAAVRKEYVNFNIDSSNIIEKKLRSRPKHGAIVTQVVDVTPGRHAKENIFSEILLNTASDAAAVSRPTPPLAEVVHSAVATENSTVDIITENMCSSVTTQKASKAVCNSETTNSTTTLMESNNLDNLMNQNAQIEISHEMAAAAASLTMMANKFTKLQTAHGNNAADELQNEYKGGGDTLQPVEETMISTKLLSDDTVASNMADVSETQVVISTANDIETQAINSPTAPSIDGDADSQRQQENTNSTTAIENNGFVRLEDGTSCCSSACEDSSSDCFLSQLANAKKLSKSVTSEAKDSTITLLNFDVTPTISGESRDVYTPAQKPLPTVVGGFFTETEQQQLQGQKVFTPVGTALQTDSMKRDRPLTPKANPSKTTLCSEQLNKSISTTSKLVYAKDTEKSDAKVNPILTQEEPAKFVSSLTPTPKQQPSIEKTISFTIPADATSATTDYEVSSTQEQIEASTNHDISADRINDSAMFSVQNSESDTTQHSQEKLYPLRRRTSKLSDDTPQESVNNMPITKAILRQRRPPIAADSANLHVHFAPSTIFPTDEENVRTTSSSTTTTTGTEGDNVGGGDGDDNTPTSGTKPTQNKTRRRNQKQKSNNSQSPLSARKRKSSSVSELNGNFVFGCSRLQAHSADSSDVEHCVVLPASAVVPPVNLTNISRAYASNSFPPIKIFVPPSRGRGRPAGSTNKNSKTQKQVESADKVKAKKTEENLSKANKQRIGKKRANIDNGLQTENLYEYERQSQLSQSQFPALPTNSKGSKIKKVSINVNAPMSSAAVSVECAEQRAAVRKRK